jgi:hypothetical protein
MMSMAKRRETHDVDYKAESADYEKLVEPMELMPFPESLDRVEDDL